MAEPLLKITNLHAEIAEDGTEILKGVDLEVNEGEIHAIMGPNGSGKSTLSKVISGHPAYEVTDGEILFRGQSVLDMQPDERARAGIFLAFQYPVEIPGVSVANFMRTALNAKRGGDIDIFDFQDELEGRMGMLEMDPAFAARSVNEGFSGGEKKRNEILQLAMLEPVLAVMDETDSGLDIDALKIVTSGINTIKAERNELTVLLITHYQRMLNYITPDKVHVMVSGRIIMTGGAELALELEEKGYDWVRTETAGAV
ncbi:MAG TPA: Fe-S cluster assembly ATPase SufC [Longimicrobiaceae bacterium]|jgi:Fe-S cluster assembly ATP-binding protein|nr:Fe-S cluster assembly ATPase SufC [Longimicrobiaceae bacterium]